MPLCRLSCQNLLIKLIATNWTNTAFTWDPKYKHAAKPFQYMHMFILSIQTISSLTILPARRQTFPTSYLHFSYSVSLLPIKWNTGVKYFRQTPVCVLLYRKNSHKCRQHNLVGIYLHISARAGHLQVWRTTQNTKVNVQELVHISDVSYWYTRAVTQVKPRHYVMKPLQAKPRRQKHENCTVNETWKYRTSTPHSTASYDVYNRGKF